MSTIHREYVHHGTTIKGRKPLAEVNQLNQDNSNNLSSESEMTVEQFLTQQCDGIILDLQEHCANLIDKLRNEYNEGAQSIRELMSSTTSQAKRICVTLKCIAGSHMGQKFRCEPAKVDEEDTFKIGRSTGKLFKEKGVSLYKDKEISTTHAKLEIRNGQAFLVDVRSTNGTLLNGNQIEAQVPLRLRTGDIIAIGVSELKVFINEVNEDEDSEDENFASV